MKSTKVVNLRVVREMLAVIDHARAEILAGRLTGVFAALRDEGTGETIYLGGEYRSDPDAAMYAGMKAAAASSFTPLLDEDPPQFLASRM